MNRKALSTVGMIASAAAISLTSSVALAEPPRTFNLSVPIVDLNNPCTPGQDSIDGSLDVKAVLKINNGVKSLQISAKGDGTDAYGVDYLANARLSIKIRDPFPAQAFLKARLISKGSGDNAFLNAMVHVSEQGNITKIDISGIECKG